jgi:hypothetical protein
MYRAENAVREQPTFAPALRVLAASSASLGRMAEAMAAFARLKDTNVPVRITELWHFPFRDQKYFTKYTEALRKAELPQ